MERGLPPPPTLTAIHVQVLDVAQCLLAVVDYISAHNDDTQPLIEECKWRLENIIRGVVLTPLEELAHAKP